MPDAAKEILVALLIFTLGLAALLYIQFGPGVALQNSLDAQITFRSFPSAISILLMALSGALAVGHILAFWRSRGTAQDDAASSVDEPSYLKLRMLALVALLIAFTLLIGMAPLFVLASAFLFIAFFIFGQTDLLRVIVVALIGGALFHGLFILLLNLPLN